MTRIVWIDDNRGEYDKLQQQWQSDNIDDYTLEFISIEDIMAENNAALVGLLGNPPDILLLDWNEGGIKDYYPELKEKIKISILVSWSSHDILSKQRVFEDYPEFNAHYLSKPFSTFRLMRTIDLAAKEHDNWLAHIKDAVGKGTTLLHSITHPRRKIGDLLMIRYLNDELQPVAKSQAWKLDLDHPFTPWDKDDHANLLAGKMVQQSIFTRIPNNPEQFGPVHFFTERLQTDAQADWPEEAVFYQKALALPVGSMGLEMFGKSVDSIIDLMRQAGFSRGRFYHLTFVPGLTGPSLELVARFPDEPGNQPLPAAKAIDTQERSQLKEYCEKYEQLNMRTEKKELIYNICQIAKNGENDNFWAEYICDNHITHRLEIPVFLNKNELERRETQITDELRKMRGLFVFDKGNNDTLQEKHVRAIESVLLSAINYYAKARKKEHEDWKQLIGKRLLRLHKDLGSLQNSEAVAKALIQAALDVDSYDIHGSNPDAKKPNRTASFARFNEARNQLEVVCETDNLMTGFEFPLDSDFFVMARCANRALRCQENENPSPIFEPDFDSSETRNRDRQQNLARIKQCQDNPDLVKKCMDRVASVKSVAAFPVWSTGKLLGVLVLRSSHPHEFTRRRVEVISHTVEVALPYLQRFRDEAQRRTAWDGLVMHEMRSNLSWAIAKLDRLQHASSKEERIQTAEELMLILEDGYSLSDMFLRWLGYTEEQEIYPTDADFWKNLDDYGKFRSTTSEHLKWDFTYNPLCQGENAMQFARALRVLIDNAFRYARGGENIIFCNIDFSEDGKYLLAQITNSGVLNNPTKKERNWAPPAVDVNISKNFKAKIGLTLVKMLCNDVKIAGPDLRQDNSDSGNPRVIARLLWPKHSHTSQGDNNAPGN